jgi:uncharacterized protein (DUF58 family)
VTITARTAYLALAGVLVVFFLPLGGAMIFAVEGALVVAVGIDLLLAGSVRSVQVSRSGDTARRLDETAVVGVELVNRGSRVVRGVARDAWPPSAQATPSRRAFVLAPGQRCRLVTTITPTRRTELHAGRVTLRSAGPFGLASRQGNHDVPWQLRVLPGFPSRRYLPEKLSKLRLLDGRTAARTRGQGTEFDSLRDFVEGDDVRSIDWRATARRSTVVVRTWRPERDRRLVLVLDVGRTSAARIGAGSRLDTALDAALLLGTLAARAGDHVDLMVADVTTRVLLRGTAAGSASALPDLLSAMGGLQPRLMETDSGRLVAEVLRRTRERALIVLFTALDTAAVSEGLLPLLPALTRRHVVLVASVSDPQVLAMADLGAAVVGVDATTVYDAAAAEKTLAEQRKMAQLLRRSGAEVVEAGPDTFASAVADSYLDMKAAGRL